MPPSQLRGAPSVTTYVYDDAGRVARTVTASPWTEEDRALMLGLVAYEDSICPGRCGQPKAEAHHPDNEGWYHVCADPDAAADPPLQCHACGALEQWEADAKREVPAGVFPVLVHDRDYAGKPLPPLPARLVGRVPARLDDRLADRLADHQHG